jgi:hypothetical protein
MDRQLIKYLPPVIRGVQEYIAICDIAEQPEFEAFWGSVDNVFNDQFVQSATENGVKRWEKILGLYPKSTDSLDTRKAAILARLNEDLPYTERRLREMLDMLCGTDGYILTVDGLNYKIYLGIKVKAKDFFDAAKTLIEKVLPANMVLNFEQRSNTYQEVSMFTHRYLSYKTHDQIRNEVL